MKLPSKKPVLFMLLFSGIFILLILLMQPLEVYHFRDYIAVLFPEGKIAAEERNLLLIIQALMLLVIVPVYILTFIFSWIYRADNPKGKYDPDLVDNRLAEYIWWGVPLVMTAIVCVITGIKTYELDPYKPIASDKKEMTIQVVALQWRWLFLYPEEKIASLNFLQIPKDTPIKFEITSDAPMNSFWIPELGGQIYAMPNMKTTLYLIADHEGEFMGLSANLSGEGFSGMNFITKATSEEDYDKWVDTAKKSDKLLTFDEYDKLAKPSKERTPGVYQLKDDSLFEHIFHKYLQPKKVE